MSTITQPIREILKSYARFYWEESQQSAFDTIRKILSEQPVLVYYDVSQPVTITCDASQSGLGAALLQNTKPVAYASRALTNAKMRYTQIEKELLAVVFAFYKFHQYTYRKEVTVESDHKPLEIITKKRLSDTLSRAYLDNDPTSESLNEDFTRAVNTVIRNQTPS